LRIPTSGHTSILQSKNFKICTTDAHAYHSEHGYIAYIAHTYTVGEGEPDLAAIAVAPPADEEVTANKLQDAKANAAKLLKELDEEQKVKKNV